MINRELDQERERNWARGKSLLLLGDCLTVFGFHFGADSISEEVARFSPFMVSPRKNTVFIVSLLN